MDCPVEKWINAFDSPVVLYDTVRNSGVYLYGKGADVILLAGCNCAF